MSEVAGTAGAPWERPLHGALDKLVVESEALAGNPLGDPARRPLYVYRSPGVVAGTATGVASVYVLQGFGGQLDMWLERPMLDHSDIERLDQLWAPGAQSCPEAVIVFVDAWTSLGGSQFLNSAATGNYTDYVCDEIVPFIDSRYPTAPPGSAVAAASSDSAATGPFSSRRGVAGKSSGGYGAMVLPMLRPGLFAALATQAGDALFENAYLRDFPKAARALRDNFAGSYENFLAEYRARTRFDFGRYGDALNIYAMACCYSPDPHNPGRPLLPFDPATGRLIDDVWQQWLSFDPVRMAPLHAEALAGLRRIYIDAGLYDEYFLDLGATAFSHELNRLEIGHTLDLYPGGHRGAGYRQPPAIRELLLAL